MYQNFKIFSSSLFETVDAMGFYDINDINIKVISALSLNEDHSKKRLEFDNSAEPCRRYKKIVDSGRLGLKIGITNVCESVKEL